MSEQLILLPLDKEPLKQNRLQGRTCHRGERAKLELNIKKENSLLPSCSISPGQPALQEAFGGTYLPRQKRSYIKSKS